MAPASDTVVVRMRQSVAGPDFTHRVGQLVEMPTDVADAYYHADVVEGVDDYDEEDVVPFGSDRRRGAPPGGRRATAEPAGRQTTNQPGGRDARRRPSGQDRDQGDSDDPDPGDVPTSVSAVQAWVGDDQARAAVALQVEQARKGGVRKTLGPWLEELATAASGS